MVKNIEECIMATKPGRLPSNLCEEILKDADTYHLGTKDFKLMNKLVIAENKIRDPEFDTKIAEL